MHYVISCVLAINTKARLGLALIRTAVWTKKKKKDANTLNDQAKFYILHVAKDSGHIGTVQIREGTEVFFEEKNSFSSIQNTFDDFPCQWP